MPRAKRISGDPAQPQGKPAQRDKLTVAEFCDDLGISKSTFYEWRAKGKAPHCFSLPNGSLRIRRSEYERWLREREDQEDAA